jgi:hypothetical protein
MSSAGVLQGSTGLIDACTEHRDEGYRIRNLLQYFVEIFDDRRGPLNCRARRRRTTASEGIRRDAAAPLPETSATTSTTASEIWKRS